MELELGKSICHQVRDAGFLIPITSKGFNVGHDLVPWSKTQKKFQWFFKPAQVWIYTDNRVRIERCGVALMPLADRSQT